MYHIVCNKFLGACKFLQKKSTYYKCILHENYFCFFDEKKFQYGIPCAILTKKINVFARKYSMIG